MKTGIFFGQNAVDQNAAAYDGWPGLLTGCVPDARDLSIAFASMGFDSKAKFSGWNVDGKYLPWIMSCQCTRDAWRQAHADLQAIAKPGDIIVIGNSGHGYQYDTPFAFNGGQGMCFWDGMLKDSEQFDLMKGWKAGVFCLYIIDTCYSGGMDRQLRFPVRSAPEHIRPRGPIERPEMKSSDLAGMVIQYCASKINQTAEDGPNNGAFTGSLLSVWDQSRSAGKKLSIRDWFSGTAALMGQYFPKQDPVMNVLGQGSDALEVAL